MRRLVCFVGLEASGVRWTECFSIFRLSSYTLDYPKKQPYQTRTFFTLFSQIQTEGKGKEGTEIQTTALNIYMDSSERECVYVCVRFLSRHVCTRLLTYTVYSWLGCEPGALKSCVASPHSIRTPTTRGHSLCLGLGVGGLLFLIAPFRSHFSFFFLLHCFYFSTPLSFNSFLRFGFLLSCFLPLET